MSNIRKISLCIVYLILFSFFVTAENFNAKAERDKLIAFFQDVVTLFCSLGNTTLTTFEDEWAEDGLETLNDILDGMTYGDFQKSIDLIKNNMEVLENSGGLSSVELKNFKQVMSDIRTLHEWNIERCEVPSTISLIYDNSAILKLEEQAEIYKSNINDYEKELKEMQQPEEIKNILDSDRELLSQLRSKNKNTKDVEDHLANVAAIYSSALMHQKNLKEKIQTAQQFLADMPDRIKSTEEEAYIRASKAYRKDMCKKINNIQTWIDFFDHKNTVLTDFLKLINTERYMNQKIDEVVPLEEISDYHNRLKTFLKTWMLP